MSYNSEKEFIISLESLFNNAKHSRFSEYRLSMNYDTDIIVTPEHFKSAIVDSANKAGNDPCNKTLSLMSRFILSNDSTNVKVKRKEYMIAWIESIADIYLYNEKYKDSNMFNAIMLNGLGQPENNVLHTEFIDYIYDNYLSQNTEVMMNSEHEVYSDKNYHFLAKAFMKYVQLVMSYKDNCEKVKLFWNKEMLDFKERVKVNFDASFEKFSFLDIPEKIIDERIDVNMLMYFRANEKNNTTLNESLNILLNKKASPEQIMQIYLLRIFHDSAGAKMRESYDQKTLRISDENISITFLKKLLHADACSYLGNDYLTEQLKEETTSLFKTEQNIVEYFEERIRIAERNILYDKTGSGIQKKAMRI